MAAHLVIYTKNNNNFSMPVLSIQKKETRKNLDSSKLPQFCMFSQSFCVQALNLPGLKTHENKCYIIVNCVHRYLPYANAEIHFRS